MGREKALCDSVEDWPVVGGAGDVRAGERGLLPLEVDLAERGMARVFLYIVRGRSDGPTFHLLAGQHGVELNGCAAVETFVNSLDPAEVSGTVLAAPVANPISAAQGEQYPVLNEGVDSNMNRVWPGSPAGSFIERLAWAIWEHGLSDCDWCLDVHSWNRGSAPAALLSTESDALVAFGRATGLLFLRITEPLPAEGYTRFGPTVARREGRAIGCCMELSGQYMIYPDQVELGRRILGNLLKHAKMLSGEPVVPERYINIATAEGIEVRSPADALMQQHVALGEVVRAGDAIARLWRFDNGKPEWLVSPADGGLRDFGALDQMKANGYDRGMSSAVRAGERVATVVPFGE